MQSPSSPSRLMCCDDLLAQLLAGMPPLVPCQVPLSQMRSGMVAAALPGLAAGLPPLPLALRAGYALRADDLIGAGPQSPVMLMSPPPLVQAGARLPEGADAVLDPAALCRAGPVSEISAETFPGEGVLPAGHHLSPHTPLLQDGEVIGPARLLLLAMAGVTEVPCRIPRVDVTGDDPASVGYLTEMALKSGAIADRGTAAIRLHLSEQPPPEGDWLCQGLALNGLQDIAVAQSEGCVTIRFAPRPDLLALVALGLMLPLIDHLSRRQVPQSLSLPLSRKISSPVGMSELLPLRREGGSWVPLPAGELSLAALSGADALLRIPAGEEGWPAGHLLALPPLERRL
ncbi:molybdopterin-binding domain-containing protein [Falsigemmobacter faecalis]|uniref:Molybdopterin molybdenumtransferase n=1 Tax=Falsigemmobacter faecalis TaxID=2488730 RepID=A0A3P3DVC9_9RHOB|nr:hypothetical protein [Falsigemmobacter faecalis]RRH78200.1 hypothetical protein EG244_01765 [Falsigemmobacter faecalis]